MKVFIMWADKRSQIVAEALHSFLRVTVQGARYFLSTQDIGTGADWSAVIRGNLEEATVGIAVLTPENLDNRWIHFEAGAISKIAGKARLIPFLVGVDPVSLKLPLSIFQWSKADEQGIDRVLQTILEAMPDELAPDPAVVARAKGYALKDLMAAVKDALAIQAPAGKATTARSDRDIMEEILALVRREGTPTAPPGPRSSFMPFHSMNPGTRARIAEHLGSMEQHAVPEELRGAALDLLSQLRSIPASDVRGRVRMPLELRRWLRDTGIL